MCLLLQFMIVDGIYQDVILFETWQHAHLIFTPVLIMYVRNSSNDCIMRIILC